MRRLLFLRPGTTEVLAELGETDSRFRLLDQLSLLMDHLAADDGLCPELAVDAEELGGGGRP